MSEEDLTNMRESLFFASIVTTLLSAVSVVFENFRIG